MPSNSIGLSLAPFGIPPAREEAATTCVEGLAMTNSVRKRNLSMFTAISGAALLLLCYALQGGQRRRVMSGGRPRRIRSVGITHFPIEEERMSQSRVRPHVHGIDQSEVARAKEGASHGLRPSRTRLR